MCQSRVAGDVGERAVPIVVKQVVGRFLALGEAFKRGSVDKKDVEPAVMVVVEERDSAPHFLDQVVLFRRAAEDVDGRPQPRFRGDVGEANLIGLRLGCQCAKRLAQQLFQVPGSGMVRQQGC